MRTGHRYLGSLLMTAMLVSAAGIVGCVAHHGYYRVYDPYYRDYHPWDDHETVYYQRWEVDTHRVHREFRRLNANVQKEYWDWRHSHSD
jgi:hypothetical protein